MPSLYFALLIIAAVIAPAASAQSAAPGTEEYFMPEIDESVMQAPPPSAMPESETQTGRWLLLQSSGKSAGSRYAIPGQVATLSYRRYLNSFRYPIPRQFSFGGTTSGTAGGAGGGMSGGGGMGGGSGAMPY